MNQIDLMVACQRMRPGQCLQLSAEEMWDAASGSLPSPLMDGPARREDVQGFVARIEDNWRLRISEEPLSGRWTIRKENTNG